MSELDAFFEDFDDDLLTQNDDDFQEIADKFFVKFNETIPLSLLPTRISIDELRAAVEECIATNDNDILRKLNIQIHPDALY